MDWILSPKINIDVLTLVSIIRNKILIAFLTEDEVILDYGESSL